MTTRGRLTAINIVENIVVWSAAITLYTAAVLKSFGDTYALPQPIIHGPLSIIVLIFLEVGMASWLISGIFRYLSVIVSSVLFLVFGSIALSELAQGTKNCGCFGIVKTSPWISLILDSCFFFGLTLCVYLHAKVHLHRNRRAFVSLSLLIITSAISVFGLESRKDIRSISSRNISNKSDLIVLTPSDWVGASFPLSAQITPIPDFHEDHWVVVLYHWDCPTCQQAIANWTRYCHVSNYHLALIELPPVSAKPRPANIAEFYGQLSAESEWFVEAPVAIRLDHGIVRDAAVGEEAVDSPNTQ